MCFSGSRLTSPLAQISDLRERGTDLGRAADAASSVRGASPNTGTSLARTSSDCLDFIEALNQNLHNIVLTHSMSLSSGTFLDLQVTMENGSLSTRLCRKPTATSSLLKYRSFHPAHTKRGVPIGQFLRARRNCTEDNDFQVEARDLTSRLKGRNYPRRCISVAYERARSNTQASLLTTKPKVERSKPCFITTFNTHW
ncbi:unnamed protein product [Ranitomeya imitator]|uniref:Helix-turn-helix domain-containing protein n=1 Tax=Ranitomeya imitator TaxID=111125 RepID=A0ABN9LPD1_9NEOB|nr:unnamed protein product [Ranitomeya imitator]